MRTRWKKHHELLLKVIIILPLLKCGILPPLQGGGGVYAAKNEEAVSHQGVIERPICDQELRSKYCNAWYGGDLHTGNVILYLLYYLLCTAYNCYKLSIIFVHFIHFIVGCRYCGLGLHCPSKNPSGRGLKNQPELRNEILRRHNLYREEVRLGKTNLPPTKCLPELR